MNRLVVLGVLAMWLFCGAPKTINAQETKRKNEAPEVFWNKETFWSSPALSTPYSENISDDEKIAGLSKFWSEVKYNFANFDLVPNLDWDALYLAYLPKVRQTKSTREYYSVLQEMCARLKDGHTNVLNPKEVTVALLQPPLRTGIVENKVLITAIHDERLRQEGIEPGQEVLAVNGIPVKQYAEKRVIPYQSASTKQNLELTTYDYTLLAMLPGDSLELTLQDGKGRIFKKNPPLLPLLEMVKLIPQNESFEFKILPGNIAYAAFNTFGDEQVVKQFEAVYDSLKQTNALIIDLRNNGGGNGSVAYGILNFLTDKPYKTSRWLTRSYHPAFRAWKRAEQWYGDSVQEQTLSGTKLYAKPVTVLTSPRTASAAEDFLVAFDYMKRGKIIGEATAGTTGQPLYFNLPGGGRARVCTKRDTYPDGKEFVGVGIQPDIKTHLTIQDFRSGRDTVLQSALSHLRESGKK